MVMEWVIGKMGFDSQQETEFFISSKTSNIGCGDQTVSCSLDNEHISSEVT